MSFDRFAGVNTNDGPDDLAEQFRQAVLSENVDAFGECIDRLQQALSAEHPAGYPLIQVFRQLRMLFLNHKQQINEWLESDPDAKEGYYEFLDWCEKMCADDDGS